MLIRLSLMATILVAAPALAQTPASPLQGRATTAAVLDACQADLRTLCGSEPFQINRLTQCVRQNQDKLSPACQTVWPDAARQASHTDARAEAGVARQACAADLRTHCGDKRGRARAQCLSDNLNKFSEACRTARASLLRVRQEERRGGNQQDGDKN
jgi:hypothetical protein